MRHREAGIQRDRPLEMRDALDAQVDAALVEGERVGMQRIERRRRRARQRRVELLNRRERLAEPASELRGDLPKRRQDLLLAGRLRLVPCHDVAALGVDRFDGNRIVPAQALNRARDVDFQLFPARNLARDRASRARRPAAA
jgi:hypothetical protein